jgi:hypothetical protein
MHVIIQMQPGAAQAVRQRIPRTAAPEELLQIAEELGVVLTPLHPGTDDTSLAQYLTAEVADPAAAHRLIARLSGNPAIQAAYLKPADELP